MKQFILKHWCQLIIFFLVLVLFLTNYRSGTYLIGWDNLQTELYPGLAVKRAFFAVWQEYQSFGLVSGMAHAADLVRAVFVWLISFVLPNNLVRYGYHFFLLYLGASGSFKLFKKLKLSNIISLLGACFYLLNFGTVQNFYLPYEAFSHFWASFPWLILVWLAVIDQKNQDQNKYLKFFLINLLATPSFYVQTIFIVYLLSLGSISLIYLFEKNSQSLTQKLGRLSFGLLLILLINSFWLLPQLYFLKNASNNVIEAKGNQLSNQVMINQNASRGTIWDFVTLKGYYYDLNGPNDTKLFQPWQNYFHSSLGIILETIVVVIIILGLLKKQENKKYFLALFILNAIFLLSNTLIFREINLFFRQIPILNQLFRSPFTKFITPHILVMSFFFSSGLNLLNKKLNKSLVVSVVCLIFIFLYSFPSFQGYFISPLVKIKIPDKYLRLFTYFKNQDKNKRIALLPEYTYWGWFNHDWGYYGSGFIWYGIEQPIVSRTFDVWSEKSESYFWEMRRAITSRDKNLFNNVLEKYKIDYLIFDKTLFPIGANYKALNIEALQTILANNQNIIQVNNFGEISVYKYLSNKKNEQILNIGPKVDLTENDNAFSNYGDYITNDNQPKNIYLPFLTLQSFNQLKKNQMELVENPNSITVKIPITNFSADYSFNQFPDNKIVYQLFYDDQLKKTEINPVINFSKNQVSVDYKKYSLLFQNFSLETNNDCGKKGDNFPLTLTNKELVISSKNGDRLCFGYHFNYLTQNLGYLLKVDAENIQGDSLFFYLFDNTDKQTIIEDRLKNGVNYYIIPPIYQYGLGYSFNFNNTSYGNIESRNIIKDINLYPFPYQFLKDIQLINPFSSELQEINQAIEIEDSNHLPWLYQTKIDLRTSGDVILRLNQTFDKGWKAWVNGKEIKNHVLVNNWANGWALHPELLGTEVNIVIVFWPQYLEFAGFGLLILAILLIIKRYKKNFHITI